MKRICLFLIAFTLLLAGCNSNKVKVRGKVIGLQGTVKLLAEMPGQQGLVILAQQDVTDGNIDLETEALQIPARVWVDVAGKNTLEFILDSKDQIWIQGKIKFPDQIEVKGSGLDMEYAKLKKMFKEKYEGPIEPIDKAIKKIMEKPKRSKEEEVLLGVHQLQRQRYIRARAKYVKNLIEVNSRQPALAVRTRFKTCTKSAGGLPPPRFSASNFQLPAWGTGRPAIHAVSSGIPFQRCGFK